MSEKLLVIADSSQKEQAICLELGGLFDIDCAELGKPVRRWPTSVLIDVELPVLDRLFRLRDTLLHKPAHVRLVILADSHCHSQTTQAYALGAHEVLPRPLRATAFVRESMTERCLPAPDDPIASFPKIAQALDVLDRVFSSALRGQALDVAQVTTSGEIVVGHIEESGLESWIEIVRTHHNQTYQHSLLVTGVIVAFGQQLKLSQRDRNRLAFAGLLHDIGKAGVPVRILEKPVALTDSENAIMRTHPAIGYELLKKSPEVSAEVLDVVLHHHEYLDGTGYPDRLSGTEISDYVRFATICDIFGALIERRPYKPALRGDVAYQSLVDMGSKLDRDFVRAFSFAKALTLSEASA